MKTKIVSLALAGALALLSLSACSQLDVVAQQSAQSLQAVLDAAGDLAGADEMTGGWALNAPDGGAAFIWMPDYSTGGPHDIMLVYDMGPFVAAGLDPEKLPDGFTVVDDKLMVGTKLGSDKLTYGGDPTPLASYEQLAERYPGVIGYHTALDHFGVTVAEGTMFEWAKDMSTNDKDIVFVLNPQPLIDAGVDPEAVEGWAYAPVTVDMGGKPAEVYKFLKPFDLQ